jgi:hypothetical protein
MEGYGSGVMRAPRPTKSALAVAALASAAALLSPPAQASLPGEEPPSADEHESPQPQGSAPPEIPPNAQSTPAVRYASLGQVACEAELRRRHVPFVRVEARGVLAPVRLKGPVSGVTFRSQVPERQRATSPYEIFDCRLVLALDDFAKLLAKQDIVEVIHYSAYRPPSAKSWVPGKIGSRHGGALALDAGKFIKKDGTVLDVEKGFHGRIGARTCGPGTGPSPQTPEALSLRSLACDSAQGHLFNVILTPNYNWPHRNHFHLEVTSGVKWYIVH